MKFTKVKHKSGSSHSFKVYSIKGFYKDFSKEDLEELTGYEVGLFKSEEDENIEPQIYTLQKKYFAVVTRYSVIIFPKIEDLLFAIDTRKKAIEWAKRNDVREYYIKKINPNSGIVLTNDGTAYSYIAYAKEEEKMVLSNFPKERVELINLKPVKIVGKDGRIAYRNHYSEKRRLLIFENEMEFESWYNPMMMFKDSGDIVWKGRNPYHDSVLKQKEEILTNLADLINLKKSEITIDKKGEQKVHRALRNFIFDDKFINQIFLPLTIYLGELQIKFFGGEWQIEKRPVIETSIPVIFFNSTCYNIGKYVMWDLLNPEKETFNSLSTVLWNGKTKIF